MRIWAMVLLLLAVFASETTIAQTCPSSPARHSFHASAEVAGNRSFLLSVNERWTFVLQRVQYGWSIRLKDATGVDLSAVTPPFRSGVNHRDIEGWHFRNADNSDSNDGSMNAPQDLRLFVFDPSLEGTGGFRPPDQNGKFEAEASPGRGAFWIHDYGLADLGKGEKARMVYLKFDLCLAWPKSEQEMIEEANYHRLEYKNEERESMYGCGLAREYVLDAWMKPRWARGNLDGDDVIDDIAQIRRKSDGQRGIALCRSGALMRIFGMEGEFADDLPENGFGGLEHWGILRLGDKLANGNTFPKGTKANVLSLERVEKSQHIIYWSGEDFVLDTVLKFVEPDQQIEGRGNQLRIP